MQVTKEIMKEMLLPESAIGNAWRKMFVEKTTRGSQTISEAKNDAKQLHEAGYEYTYIHEFGDTNTYMVTGFKPMPSFTSTVEVYDWLMSGEHVSTGSEYWLRVNSEGEIEYYADDHLVWSGDWDDYLIKFHNPWSTHSKIKR